MEGNCFPDMVKKKVLGPSDDGRWSAAALRAMAG